MMCGVRYLRIHTHAFSETYDIQRLQNVKHQCKVPCRAQFIQEGILSTFLVV